MKRKKPPNVPTEIIVRWQRYCIGDATTGWEYGHCRVVLAIWPNQHQWMIAHHSETIFIDVDRALDQIELFRWLAKTLPVE